MAPAAKSSKVKEMFKPYNEADVPDIMPFPDLATVAASNGEHIAVPKLNQHQRSYILDVALRNADLGDLGTQKEANEFYDQVKTQALDAKAFQHKVQPGDRAEEASLSERINTWKLENPSLPKWMAHPDGRIPAHSPNLDLMYSTTVPYSDIKPVRAALTAFSTQTIGKKVGDEAENAVKLSSGLHVSIGKKHPETKLRREDFGEGTIPHVQSVIERDQAITLYLFKNIATRKPRTLPRTRAGVIIERQKRPADAASFFLWHVESLSLLLHLPDQANLLPLMRGILYFGSSAPVELMNYNSRIGNMPAPATIRRALISLSTEEARATQLPMARKLYRAYGTARGRDHAMYDTGTERGQEKLPRLPRTAAALTRQCLSLTKPN
ncbi:hypothetical protein DFH09DRAFT_1342705 [Mycena vulgaris]|nr:hypothetical protein DFH09DRAFT_1342705 [Mycena vulgaris]